MQFVIFFSDWCAHRENPFYFLCLIKMLYPYTEEFSMASECVMYLSACDLNLLVQKEKIESMILGIAKLMYGVEIAGTMRQILSNKMVVETVS